MNFHSTEQKIIWFRDRYSAGELELKPPFQRQPVWAAKQKSFLIESILLELPIPEVYIQHVVRTVNGVQKSMYYVVDGQQRIRTVLQFIGADQTESEEEFNKFALDKLPSESDFKDATFATLTPTQSDAFMKYKFAVRELDVADDQSVRDIFVRLNKYLTKLNEQELRNATFTGPFIRLALALSNDKFWAESDLVTPAQIRRMKDIEFVSELLIGLLHGPQGGDARTINEYYTVYEDYDDQFPGQRALEKRFTATFALVKDVLPMEEEGRFRHNRTDFYSVFVAFGYLLRTHELLKSQHAPLRRALVDFEESVDERLSDETKRTSNRVINYARATAKAANDKSRRAARHTELVSLIEPFFKELRKA